MTNQHGRMKYIIPLHLPIFCKNRKCKSRIIPIPSISCIPLVFCLTIILKFLTHSNFQHLRNPLCCICLCFCSCSLYLCYRRFHKIHRPNLPNTLSQYSHSVPYALLSDRFLQTSYHINKAVAIKIRKYNRLFYTTPYDI